MTSIEWLEEKAKEFAIDLDLLNYFEQAKEMHKKEMENTWFDSTMQFHAYAEMTNKKLFDDYYEETFKKD